MYYGFLKPLIFDIILYARFITLVKIIRSFKKEFQENKDFYLCRSTGDKDRNKVWFRSFPQSA